MKSPTKEKVTLEDIEAIEKEFLTPDDVAPYLHRNPYSINLQLKKSGLPWAYLIGTEAVIPKQRFINYHKGVGI